MADVVDLANARARRAQPLLRTAVGRVLRRSRLEQERTLADVAGAARVSLAYLSEVERGRKEASSEVLAALCDALRIELADLLEEVHLELKPQYVLRRQTTVGQGTVGQTTIDQSTIDQSTIGRSTVAPRHDAQLLAAQLLAA